MAEKMANPFLALFPTDDAATKAREMKEKQHHELQATLKRVFLITGESKTDNDINVYNFYDFHGIACFSHKKLLLRLTHLVTWSTYLSLRATKSTWNELGPSRLTTMIR